MGGRIWQWSREISHKEIAHRLNKSITPIHMCIKRLQQDGYIRKYTALLDAKKLGRKLIAYTQVQLKEYSQEQLMAFQAEVIKLDKVMECYRMTGALDFVLRIAIGDMEEYNQSLIKKLSKLPEVGTMQSYLPGQGI